MYCIVLQQCVLYVLKEWPTVLQTVQEKKIKRRPYHHTNSRPTFSAAPVVAHSVTDSPFSFPLLSLGKLIAFLFFFISFLPSFFLSFVLSFFHSFSPFSKIEPDTHTGTRSKDDAINFAAIAQTKRERFFANITTCN